MVSYREPSELPPPSSEDFAEVVDSVVNGDDWLMTRVRGRYKGVGAFRDLEDVGLPSDVAKEQCVVVKTRHEELVAVVPFEFADEFLEMIRV